MSVLEVGRALLASGRDRLLEVLRRHPHEELGVALEFDGGSAGSPSRAPPTSCAWSAAIPWVLQPLIWSARSSAAVSSSVSGTMRETSPISAASGASTSRPDSMISNAREEPMARGSRKLRPSSVAVRPLLIPAARKYADSVGDPDVGAQGEAEPTTDRRAVDRADHGLWHPLHRRDEVRQDRHRAGGDPRQRQTVDVRRGLGVLPCRRRSRSPARPGEHHTRRVVVLGDVGRSRRAAAPSARRPSSSFARAGPS